MRRSKKTTPAPGGRPAIAALRQTVGAALRAAGVRPGDAVVVGCSHGPDSLVLADAVCALRRSLGLREVRLCYVDHGLRAEAAAEGEAVRAFAAARGEGVAAEVRRVRVRRAGGGLEDAARRARHAALAAGAEAAGARWILLAHTATDQAETVLMRLLRGTGPLGLAGIPPVRGSVLRPLLAVTRAQVEAYVAAAGLTPSRDPMNRDTQFLRVRVRERLLPALRAENPRIEAALARLAASQRELAAALAFAAARARAALVGAGAGSGVRLSAPALAALPSAVGKRLLLDLAGDLGAELAARHVDALWALATAPRRGTRTLALPGATARRVDDRLELVPGGDTPAPGVGIRRIVRVAGADGPYRVRLAHAGDRMRPARLRGRQRKLSDLYADAHVPRAARASAVVIEDRGGRVVWAEHVGAAHGAVVRVALTHLDRGVITEQKAAKR